MKKYACMALIGILVVGIAGFISLDAISATSFATAKVASNIHETGQMIGHVTYELRGNDGNIKHYSQSDNVIVDVGTDCAATAIFDTTDASAICGLGTDNGFSFIAIGNSTDAFPLANVGDSALHVDAAGNGEIDRLDGTVTITPADSANNVDTTVSIVSPAFTFELLPSGTTITQSGLFDSAAGGTDNMFSIRDIPGQNSAGLAVTSADTLSITWTITLE